MLNRLSQIQQAPLKHKKSGDDIIKTILIVEDEVIICEVLAELLTEENYKVITAKNGQEGLERLEQQVPDLIICDVMMPVLDGSDFCRAVKSNEKFQAIPLIMMSAGASLTRGECDYAGFIDKPFDLSTVIALIDTTIGR